MSSTQRKGFTLIELLIVVVIIGILASIAIPKFSSTKEKAYVTAMKSDLRNVMTSQEAYFAEKQKYGADTTVIAFKPSPNVTITIAGSGVATGAGWNGTATHTQTTKKCYLGVGADSVISGVTGMTEGQILCQ